MDPRSLYIHVPFCTRRCSYCDFAVEAMRDPPVGEWLETIGAELELLAREQGWIAPLALETLYVGGGTPSLLGLGAMSALRVALAPRAVLRPDAEWTCEANPENFSTGLAADWLEAGVGRLSLGVQSFDGDTLRWMGRLHGPDGPGRAMAAAREAGFRDVSVDLIYGLPDRLPRDWREDVERAIDLGPEHLSLYGLTAEPGTPLGRWVERGREQLADGDRYADEYLHAHERLTAAGFEHYEVSSFARPGHRSRHNWVYWSFLPYAALGPGAHAFLPPERRWNLRSWSMYRDVVRTGRLPMEGAERVGPAEASLERIWLGLRTSAGLILASDQEAEVALDWHRRGLASIEGGVVRLTPTGWLLLDRLAVDLAALEDSKPADRYADNGSPEEAAGRTIDPGPRLVQIGPDSNPCGS